MIICSADLVVKLIFFSPENPGPIAMNVPINATTAARGPELIPDNLRYDPLPGVPPQAYREIAYTDPRDGIERHLPMPQPDPENFAPCRLFMSLLWDAQVEHRHESDLTVLELDVLNETVARLPEGRQDYDRRQHPHRNWTPLVFSGEKE